DLRKTAELQRRLGDRAEKLVNRMEQLREKLTGKNDDVAEMLSKAVAIARDRDLVGEMHDTGKKQLRDQFDLPAPKQAKDKWEPQILRAWKQQGNTIQTLEQMLEVLEQSRADEIEKLTKRQQKQEKNLDEIAAKMAKLQEEIE